jgi:hypothetical protein
MSGPRRAAAQRPRRRGSRADEQAAAVVGLAGSFQRLVLMRASTPATFATGSAESLKRP